MSEDEICVVLEERDAGYWMNQYGLFSEIKSFKNYCCKSENLKEKDEHACANINVDEPMFKYY